MNGGNFVLNFLGQRTRKEPDLDYYRDYFMDYKPEKWNHEPFGGCFRFNAIDGSVHSCLIVHKEGLGVCLVFICVQNEIYDSKTTIGDPSRMQEVVDVSTDEFYPVGSFIEPDNAWPMVEQYLLNPIQFPQSDYLKNTEELNWPDPYLPR